MPFNLLVLACFLYVAFLFTVAFVVERRAQRGRLGWLRSPLVYTLSLSIYCTAWTFYGAVGYAARSGLEFLTIYFGPTLVFIGWWWLLRKLVRIGRRHRVTSIADLISSRYGKSNILGDDAYLSFFTPCDFAFYKTDLVPDHFSCDEVDPSVLIKTESRKVMMWPESCVAVGPRC